MQWQPIETAPHDNKRPLYLARFNEAGELVELDFDGAWEHLDEGPELSHINYWTWCSRSGLEEPTHWAFQDEGAPPAATLDQVQLLKDALARIAQFELGEFICTSCGLRQEGEKVNAEF